MKYSAVLFDLDGTMLDNEGVYAQAFKDVLQKHGVNITQLNGKNPQVHGIGLNENWVRLKKSYSLPEDVSVQQLSHETQDAYHARLDEVKIRPGFYELYERLSEEGILMALATSNDWWMVADELEDLKLESYFNTLVTGEEVSNKKPEPDIFLEAARKLGVEPEECVVVEDSTAGIKAAKEAGMFVVALCSQFLEKRDFALADLVVESFDEITPKVLDSFFQS